MTRDRKPSPIVKLSGGRLSPVSAYDQEELAGFPNGAEFDLRPRGKRSIPHNGLYWLQLGKIVTATDAWANAENMHEWVKLKLGYVSPIFGPKGDVIGMTIDSASFKAMNQKAFNVFHEQAAELIAREMGIEMGAV
jgi:hypothetical protein